MFARSLATIPWQQPFVAGILACVGFSLRGTSRRAGRFCRLEIALQWPLESKLKLVNKRCATKWSAFANERIYRQRRSLGNSLYRNVTNAG